ncbi:MAG: hypothetical protein EAZ57_04200 [Cytophagales bacterium]|nr:MAG: hypothetical protein EAZ67_05220 [Cytophagales bacterium]TAF61200.1 MAG: hypothetical protein EAZ57_04200 [Cytophagales bacterium]
MQNSYTNSPSAPHSQAPSSKSFQRFLLLVSAAGWVVLLLLGLFDSYVTENYRHLGHQLLKGLAVTVFVVAAYWLIANAKSPRQNKNDLYANLLSSFYLCLFCSLSVCLTFASKWLIESYLPDFVNQLYVLLYYVDFGVIAIILLICFHSFKQLILIETTRIIKNLWHLFETAILATLIVNFFDIDIYTAVFVVVFVALGAMSLSLTFNLRWTAQFAKDQKLRAIVFIMLLCVMVLIFVFKMSSYVPPGVHIFEPSKSVFFVSITLFVLTYGIVSVLGLIFSLPMASAFSTKIAELSSLRMLNESLLDGSNAQKVYLEILDSALTGTSSDAGWLEVRTNRIYNYDEASSSDLIVAKIKTSQAQTIIELLKQTGYSHERAIRFTGQSLGAAVAPFQSIICIPLIANKLPLGSLVLLRYEANAYDASMALSINHLTQQASLAIRNFKLLEQAVDTERYKEELKIAHHVQNSLLPKSFDAEGCFEVAVHTFSADVVGGDYYDYYKINHSKYAVIIGDVSGNGTSAAFHMAQMKGIFHSLVRFDPAPNDFFNYANDALASCLEKKQFITATYLVIDSENHKIYFSRAGHCPTIYYSSQTKTAELIEGRGLGLGILRSQKYAQYSTTIVQDYQKGDKLLLFTDGISEARSRSSDEEYGHERMRVFLETYQETSPQDFCTQLVADMAKFTAGTMPKDDFTIMFICF